MLSPEQGLGGGSRGSLGPHFQRQQCGENQGPLRGGERGCLGARPAGARSPLEGRGTLRTLQGERGLLRGRTLGPAAR